MAYKMDPTKKKNKNGAINKIAKGIAKAAETMIVGPIGSIAIGKYKQFKQPKNQSPSIQPSNGNGNKETTTAPDKMKATKITLAGPKANGKMKKTLTNLKRTKTSSVVSEGSPSKHMTLKKTAPKVNIKGTTLGDEKGDAPAVVVYGDKKAKTKPKKVKVKIKNNKTKIKIKK